MPKVIYVWLCDKDTIFCLQKDDKNHYNILPTYNVYSLKNINHYSFVIVNDKISFIRCYQDNTCTYLDNLIWQYSLEECLAYRKKILKQQIEDLNNQFASMPIVMGE